MSANTFADTLPDLVRDISIHPQTPGRWDPPQHDTEPARSGRLISIVEIGLVDTRSGESLRSEQTTSKVARFLSSSLTCLGVAWSRSDVHAVIVSWAQDTDDDRRAEMTMDLNDEVPLDRPYGYTVDISSDPGDWDTYFRSVERAARAALHKLDAHQCTAFRDCYCEFAGNMFAHPAGVRGERGFLTGLAGQN